MIRTLRGYEGCTATLCVDSYTQGVPRGFLFHSFLGPVPFGSLTDLLVRMETILEESGAPQSYMVPRRFEDVLPVRLPELSSPRIHRGNLATFSLQICYRRNASWQGRLFWRERGDTQSFRSVLELVVLLDSALRSVERGNAV